MRTVINGAILIGILYLTGCSHGPWVVDMKECEPTIGDIRLCNKVVEFK